jgi:hypothetical protein
MSATTPRGPGDRKEDWITHQFRRVYDDALQDSVPREMLDLLNALDERDTADSPRADESSRPDETSGADDERDEGGSA